MKARFALLTALALAACADRAASTPPTPPQTMDLQDKLFPSTWVATEIAGTPVITASKVTLSFDGAGRVSGRGGCNSYAGTATLQGDRLTFSPLAATRMACLDNAIGTQETAYFDALNGVQRVVFTPGGTLELHAENAAKPTRFTPDSDVSRLTGTVTYRQRIALPPGATLQIRVEDVSLADAPATVIAAKDIAVAGQVPLPFEIDVDPAKVTPRHTYALRATIVHEGRMLFTTDTRHTVLGAGDPSSLEIVLVQVAGP